jgi:nitronate monooxygenase
MDGHDVRRALEAGAMAAQMGTAFLACDESGASPAHKRLLREPDRSTVLTRVFSGRRARGLRNAFIDGYGARTVLPFPIQNTLTGPLRAAAVSRDDGEYQSLWAGSGYARAKPGAAADLMADLARDLSR